MKVTFPGWLGWVGEMPEDEDKEEKVSIIEKCFMEITDVYAEKLLWPSIYMDEENGYDPEDNLERIWYYSDAQSYLEEYLEENGYNRDYYHIMHVEATFHEPGEEPREVKFYVKEITCEIEHPGGNCSYEMFKWWVCEELYGDFDEYGLDVPEENYRIFLYCLNKAWQDVKALPECITKLIDKKRSTIKDDSLRLADEDGRTG